MTTKTNTFSFAGLELRSVTIDGKPCFIAKDVCAFTLHGNVTMALRGLPPEEKAQFNLGHRLTNLITEAGLYRLVMRARKRNPALVEFQTWVTGTVLPAIRQDGMYVQGEEKLSVARRDWTRTTRPTSTRWCSLFPHSQDALSACGG